MTVEKRIIFSQITGLRFESGEWPDFLCFTGSILSLQLLLYPKSESEQTLVLLRREVVTTVYDTPSAADQTLVGKHCNTWQLHKNSKNSTDRLERTKNRTRLQHSQFLSLQRFRTNRSCSIRLSVTFISSNIFSLPVLGLPVFPSLSYYILLTLIVSAFGINFLLQTSTTDTPSPSSSCSPSDSRIPVSASSFLLFCSHFCDHFVLVSAVCPHFPFFLFLHPRTVPAVSYCYVCPASQIDCIRTTAI